MQSHHASNIVVEKYNQAVGTVASRLNGGMIAPTAIAVTTAVKDVFRLNIQTTVPGSSVSHGPCSGDVPRTNAKYARGNCQ